MDLEDVLISLKAAQRHLEDAENKMRACELSESEEFLTTDLIYLTDKVNSIIENIKRVKLDVYKARTIVKDWLDTNRGNNVPTNVIRSISLLLECSEDDE